MPSFYMYIENIYDRYIIREVRSFFVTLGISVNNSTLFQERGC